MKIIKFGVIGAGGRGIISSYAHNPSMGSKLTAACDVNEKTLSEIKQKYKDHIFVTKDYNELLLRDDIDAVFVTTPDFLHEEHAVAALNAGKAVYCEKPLSITIDGADNILKAAKRNKQKLFVGHNMRYMNFTRKMKELVTKGAIGEIKAVWQRHFISYGGDAYFKDWHSEQKYTTGLLLQKAVHDIDVIHWLCGAYSRRVSGFGSLSVYDKCKRRSPDEKGDTTWRNENWPPLSQNKLSPNIDIEDLSMIHMELTNGVLASYEQCHFTPDAWRNYTIIGTEGRIENIGDFTGKCSIRIWNKRGNFKERGDKEYNIDHSQGSHGGADQKIVEEFIDYVRHGGKTYASAAAARNSVATAYQATMSIRNGGRPMEVPFLSDDLVEYFECKQKLFQGFRKTRMKK